MFFFAHGVDLGFAPRAPRYINSIHNEHHLSNLHAIFYLFYFKKSLSLLWGFPKIVVFPPKSSISIGFSIINHPFWGFSHHFWKHPYWPKCSTMFLFHAKESKRETAGMVGMAQTAGNSPRERRLQSWVKKYIFQAALSDILSWRKITAK